MEAFEKALKEIGTNTAKDALRNFTYTLALELARLHINVNNIGPGMIVTPMNQDIPEDVTSCFSTSYV